MSIGPIEVSGGMKTAKAFWEGFKKLFELSKKLENAELDNLLFEMRKQAFDVEKKHFDFQVKSQEKYQQLERKKQTLEELIRLKEEMIFEPPFYYKKEDKEGPFCQRCFDADNKCIRLIQDDPEEKLSYFCKLCKNHYEPLEVTERKRKNQMDLHRLAKERRRI